MMMAYEDVVDSSVSRTLPKWLSISAHTLEHSTINTSARSSRAKSRQKRPSLIRLSWSHSTFAGATCVIKRNTGTRKSHRKWTHRRNRLGSATVTTRRSEVSRLFLKDFWLWYWEGKEFLHRGRKQQIRSRFGWDRCVGFVAFEPRARLHREHRFEIRKYGWFTAIARYNYFVSSFTVDGKSPCCDIDDACGKINPYIQSMYNWLQKSLLIII